MSITMIIIIALIVGIIIAFIMTGSKKAALTSVHFEKYAGEYVKKKNITNKKDVFLRKEITKTAKPKEEKKK